MPRELCWPLPKTKRVTLVLSKATSQQRAESLPWSVVAWDVCVSTKVCFCEGSVLSAVRLKAWSHHEEASRSGSAEEISIND